MKDDIIDSISEEPKPEDKLITERNKLLFFAAATMLVNVIIFFILDYHNASLLALFKLIITKLFLNTAMGFFIGIFFAMIPYKKLSFDRKYLRASLYVLIGINFLWILSGIYERWFLIL